MTTTPEAIRSVITRVAHYIDQKSWEPLRALFADSVELDYTSLFGGAPETKSDADVIAVWKASLGKVSTQHLLGPIDVALMGESAKAECHVRAWHIAETATGTEEWVVGGHYVFDLRHNNHAWVIERMELQTLQQTGNRNLLKEAAGS